MEMAAFSSTVQFSCILFHSLLLLQILSIGAAASNLKNDFVVSWAPANVRFKEGGESLELVLEQSTGGAGFASKNSYLFGNIDMQIKLVPGDSAGTVTAYYLSSETSNHDELDFEFLGNSSGEPYVLQTNVFSNGVGGREQRIFLWFDPTADFHTYSVAWSKQRILFLVDGVPIRVFSNNAAAGVPYLDSQAMRVFSSIWNGDCWATRGGLVKIDWSHAPFTASYRSFRVTNSACVSAAPAYCASSSATQVAATTAATSSSQPLDAKMLKWVKSKYMTYDYCTDHARYPVPPLECTREY